MEQQCKTMLKVRSIHRIGRQFYSVKVPDNAPGLRENEAWLDNMSTTSRLGSKRRKYDKFARFPNGSFPWKYEGDESDSRYNLVHTPLSWLTDMRYLRQFSKNKSNQSNFVDVRIVKCRSGKGGDGSVSFFRDAGRSVGPPDGGDGGHGGSIYVAAEKGLDSLAKMRATYIAGDGEAGQADQLDGARGKDILITVPVGTVIRLALQPKIIKETLEQQGLNEKLKSILNTTVHTLKCCSEGKPYPTHVQLKREGFRPGEGWLFKEKDEKYHREKDWFRQLDRKMKPYDHDMIRDEVDTDKFPLFGVDLSKPTDSPICILKGGKGGLGNMHFLTNLIRNPRFAKCGREGLEQYFLFELKTIADLGLVGLPNAGKSTLLTKISNAKPRIGHWEFTTLEPTVGTISLGIEGPRFTVADIPGIIKGASKDRGMGMEFIRHIERSNGWVFVISLEKEDPLADLQILVDELGGLEVIKKKRVLVVANKADIDYENPLSREKYLRILEYCKQYGWDSIPISALHSQNIDLLLQKMAKCSGVTDRGEKKKGSLAE
ncbi:putative GTPase MTG2 [Nakaseomyces bracarensis]|uniref:putative GTPase MTG2 n=1 Tax=Nakaseomyces bracarensis TaxID=273131 RepID=UPI003871EB7E